MKICAIIAEYNPLHNGHIYHIKKAKKIADAVIIILSGHTTQRGEFSIFNKWTRAKTALLSSANLVLEMPTVFSSSSAERFATAAIKIIKELNCVDILSFGCETKDIEKLKELAVLCKEIDKTQKMKEFLKKGYSYPKARTLAIGKKSDILNLPNNLLAVEYIKSALKLNCNLSFHAVKRVGAKHDETKEEKFTSSLYLRKNIHNEQILKKYIPENFMEFYKDPIIIKDNFILNSLRLATKETFKNIEDTTEGLYNRLYSASKKATSLEEFFELVKTKRYTLSRLKRIVLSCFLGINKRNTPPLPQYSFVLGFDSIGQQILNKIKKNENFLFSTNFSKIYKNFPYSSSIDSKATDFIFLFEKKIKPCNLNFKIKPIII